MSRKHLPPPASLDFLTDPARARFRAAQRTAVCLGSKWEKVDAPPEGEVLWLEDEDRVILTPAGRLVYVNGARAPIYARLPGMQATEELVRELRGR